MSYITGTLEGTSCQNSHDWAKRIENEMGDLYPIYRQTLGGTSPCEAHYNALKEARECVENRLAGKPLPASFKAWKILEPHNYTGVVVDRQGREVFYFKGEPKEAFIVRLALRCERGAYLALSIEPLAKACEMSVPFFMDNTFQLDGGLLISYLYEKRPVYLFGGTHGLSLYDDTSCSLMALGLKGEITCFLEGYPFLPEADQALTKECFSVLNPSAPEAKKTIFMNPLFGLEHSGYYILTSILKYFMKSMQDTQVIVHSYRHLKWTAEGRKIWQASTQTWKAQDREAFEKCRQPLLVNGDIPQEIKPVDAKQILIQLACNVINDYPNMQLTEQEKKNLLQFISHPEDNAQAEVIYHFLQERRDLFFAHHMRTRFKTTPAKRPAACIVGSDHLFGLLAQLRAQKVELKEIPQHNLVSGYGKVTSYAKRMALSKQLHSSSDCGVSWSVNGLGHNKLFGLEVYTT